MKKLGRFVCSFKQTEAQVIKIWVDQKTGVNYLYIREGLAGGVCPLLDEDGKPVISHEVRENNNWKD